MHAVMISSPLPLFLQVFLYLFPLAPLQIFYLSLGSAVCDLPGCIFLQFLVENEKLSFFCVPFCVRKKKVFLLLCVFSL